MSSQVIPTPPSDMENWLITHAAENVWCRPYGDNKLIIKPRRLTPSQGETYGMSVSQFRFNMPKKDKWFHVFQLGNISPEHLGIGNLQNRWIRFDTVINDSGVMVLPYNTSGRIIPLSLAWIRELPNRNVIVAVESYDLQVDFGKDDLFLRLYDGQFRYTADYDPEIHRSHIVSKIVRNSVEISNLLSTYHTLQDKYGDVQAFVNGYAVSDLTSNVLKMWDIVDLHHDGIVKEVHQFTVGDLNTFTSTLDSVRKYLLHPPKHAETIEFYNDCDIYVFNGEIGRYYHLHQSMSLRQVTHHDYSIPSHRIQDMITENDDWTLNDDLVIKLQVRRSGMARNLIYENNRIHEMYKMTDGQIQQAMVGINSTVPEWKAANLEQSAYLKVMATSYKNLTNVMCSDAYGYNAVATYAAATPQVTEHASGRVVVDLPPLLARNCTVYEYDRNGILLGYYLHESDTVDRYYCINLSAEYVEAIEGQGAPQLPIDYDATDYTVIPGLNYRFYMDTLKSGVPTLQFEDITGTDLYSITPEGRVVWNIDLTRRQPAAWCDFGFLAYEFTADLTDGDLRFSITHECDEHTSHPMYFIPETLELWMNGRSLIPTIDFYVEWPQVVICNRQYLQFGDTYDRPKITVRARGLSDKLRLPKVGFIIDGLLSNNNRFDVRDDKIVRIVVDGALRHRKELEFSEDLSVGLSARNGAPYYISDPTIPLRRLVSYETYPYRDAAREIDTRVEDYLSIFIPQAPLVEHNPISKKHNVFSPILNKVIQDMRDGLLVPVEDDVTNMISDRQFDTLMENYYYLLDYDPVRQQTNLDYIDVFPHCYPYQIELTPIQHSMVGRINARYLTNRVVINKLIIVKVD